MKYMYNYLWSMLNISQKIGVKQEIKVNSTTSSRKDQHKHNHQNHNDKPELKGGKKIYIQKDTPSCLGHQVSRISP